MDLKECYSMMNGDYESVLSRLGSESLIEHALLMFPNDPNYACLKNLIPKGKWDEAFLAAHSLKGVCTNLSLTSLEDSVSLLVNALRMKSPYPVIIAIFEQADKYYKLIIKAISLYQEKISGDK